MAKKEPCLLFEDDYGVGKLVSVESLKTLMQDAFRMLDIVFISAC